MERYPSGLRGRFAKSLDRGNAVRGFESHPLRQIWILLTHIVMFKRILRWLFSFKYGLLIFIIISVIIAFLLGVWSAKQDISTPYRTPPETEQEKQWRQSGLLLVDGIYFVPSEVKPGIYRTTGRETSIYGCRWQRLSGFGAEQNNIIVDYNEPRGRPTIVEIASTDKGFKTQGCGQWYASSVPITDSQTQFGDGAYIVGLDIEPGTYRSSAPWGCYWERLSGFNRLSYNGRLFGQDQELIAHSSNTIATIQPSDKGFISDGCQMWVKQKLSSTD